MASTDTATNAEILLDLNKLIEKLNTSNKNSKTIDKIFKSIKSISNSSESEEEQIIKLYNIKNKYISDISKLDLDKKIVSTLFSFIDNPYPLQYNNIELKESLLHGLGVFATADIIADTIVTFYPAHAVIINNSNVETNTVETNSVYLYQNLSFNYNNKYKLYFENNIIVSANPEEKSNPLLIGHILNDGGFVCFSDNTLTEKEIKNDVCRYFIKSNNNCKFVKNSFGFCYIKTTKFIKKGEELLLSYGAKYWLNKEQNKIYDKLYNTDAKFKYCILNQFVL